MHINPKQILRAEMTRRLKISSPSPVHDEGKAACRLLRGASLWSRYGTILLFLSTPGEIDTGYLFEAAVGEGKKIFVPRTRGGRLVFCRVFDPAGPWERGPFGIREPPEKAEPLKPRDFPVLAVVPGLAFDPAGTRLGRGGACYDRFFAGESGPCCKIGFCGERQILPRLPADPWDVPMDALCTGSRFILIAEPPRE